MSIEVRTQAELDKALEKTNGGHGELIACVGGGYFAVTGNSTPIYEVDIDGERLEAIDDHS